MRATVFAFAVLVCCLFLCGLLVSSPATDAALLGSAKRLTLVRYRIDPSQSKFIVHANRTGLGWFKGHSHRIAVRDFGGQAEVSLDAANPALLEMSVRADSLEETDPVFTDQQKAIIKKELKEIVLETVKFPEIKFRSTGVIGKITDSGTFDLKITGDLTLHGTTHPIVIPASVTIDGDKLRATGEFDLDRDDFGVKATSAFHGFVRIKNNLKFDFDIVADRE